ncbi:MAG: PcfJ domain-containing protein [Schwartzia sp.]|nr:PcfJ domain-containing protein [Schwartzia sp. (in: firmicutes)]
MFCFNPEAETWQEKEGFNSVMPSISREWLQRLMPQGNEFLFVPYHWIVEAKNDGVVEVTLWLYMCTILQGEIQSIQEKEWTIACDCIHGTVQAWPIALLRERTNGWLHSFVCAGSRSYAEMNGASRVDIPTVVTEAAISFMQESVRRRIGFRPTCPGNIHGLRHMIAFCLRPFDLNIHLFYDIVGASFEQLFPRNQRDNYLPLCRFFQLEHPPKSLRKAYQDFPENLVAFVLLRQFGFRDINIIRRFFYREDLFGFRLLKLAYNSESRRMEDASRQHSNPYLIWLERFCRWFLRHRTERHLAEYLRPLVAGEWNYSAVDILRMFMHANLDRNETALQPDTLRRLLRERFTRRVHDAMVRELVTILPRDGRDWQDRINMTVHYTESEKNYVDNIAGYRFLLPQDTDELWGYGEAFHNCVASYRNDVIAKRSLILAMKRDNKYVACIEIQQRRVVQAKGPCNHSLSAEVRDVLRKWADKKKIGYRA